MSGSVVNYPQLAFDSIDEFDRLTSPEDVVRHLALSLGQFGYTSFMVVSVPSAPGGELKQIALLDGWPDGWTEHYEKEGYFQHDPVAAFGLKSTEPFNWSDVHYDAERQPRSAEVMRAAADIGLKEGFGIPIVRAGSIDAVTMAGERPDFDSRAKRAIHLIGLYAHSKAISLLHDKPAIRAHSLLTKGEREVLTWTAAGKSSWEISVILNISEATVIWRVQRACRKLNAVNRTQAVVNAIRAKEINI